MELLLSFFDGYGGLLPTRRAQAAPLQQQKRVAAKV
jgi:hypothetical protein